MPAIIKTKDIHGGIQNLLDYGANNKKTSLIENSLESLLSYGANPEKTSIVLPEEGEKSLLVSGVLCNPDTANDEFSKVRLLYMSRHPEKATVAERIDKKTGKTIRTVKQPVTAVHIIQSFEGQTDPLLVHQIGIEFCNRLGVQAVVDTHMNTDNCHNHIIVNSYMPDGERKFCNTKDKILELRRISNDVLRDYGVEVGFADPAIQLKLSKSKTMNYGEWRNLREGTSWKDAMRDDMLAIRDVAESPDEFIEIMQDYGYTISEQKDDSIMWLDKDTGKKIWDKTLGEPFKLSNMFSDTPTAEINHEPDENIIIQSEDDYKRKKRLQQIISVSRYDYSGRRRSDLELLIRRAISVIQRVSRIINKVFAGKPQVQQYNANNKLDIMTEALHTLQSFGINNVDELNTQVRTAGKNLNLAKEATERITGEMKYFNEAAMAINDYNDAMTLYNSVHFWNKEHDLHLNDYDKSTVNQISAELSPLNSKQKADLFNLMQHRPSLRIEDPGKNYSNISTVQYAEIRAFFKDRAPRPPYLVDSSIASAEHSYRRTYENIKRAMTYKPSRPALRRTKELLVAHGHTDIDFNALTMADVTNVRNCYAENPFSAPVIDDNQRATLQTKLDAKGLHISRDIGLVLTSEYDGLIRYLDGKSTKLPDLLRPDKSVTDKDIERTKSLANELGVTSTVPIEKMSNNDIHSYYNWLVSQGHEPVCTERSNPAHWDYNLKQFEDDIADETINKQEVLITLRNARNRLSELGIDPDDIPDMLSKIAEKRSEYKDLISTKNEFADDYKKLLRLKQQTIYAAEPRFLFGPLFDEKEQDIIQEEEKKQETERDTEPEAPETSAQETPEQTKRRRRIISNDLDL